MNSGEPPYLLGQKMRRDIRDRNEKGKVKFRVIDFELEGSDESLQESLRSIVSALSRPPATTAPIRSLPTAASQGRSLPPQPSTPQGELFPEDAKVEEAAEHAMAEQDEPAEVKPTRTSNAPRKYYSPKVLNELNLQGGSTPFKEFCAQKNPVADSKKYLVILSWLKESLGIESIDADHIYTCFRSMGWNPPKDVGGPLRALKKGGYVMSGKERGSYAITHIGQGVVDQLPKDS